MKRRTIVLLGLLAPALSAVHAQDSAEAPVTFEGALSKAEDELEASIAELNALREEIAQEKIPLARRLSELERELSEARAEFRDTTRLLDQRSLDLNELKKTRDTQTEQAGHVANLLGEYLRNFESRLHIAELQRYAAQLEELKLTREDVGLSEEEQLETQAQLLSLSLERLEDALGGSRFEGSAVDESGRVEPGTFALIGPYAVFRSQDGEVVGTVQQRLGSLEPTVIPFRRPEDAQAAARLVATGEGALPLDPTLGNAHKIESTEDSFLEHVQKGGPVMIPIFGLAAIALLVALYKGIALARVRRPSRAQLADFLTAVERGDDHAAREKAARLPGPTGEMLAAGLDHVDEPRELIEEILYERVLTTRLALQRLLPFIAICAASAPLLGLLGTVTGIINTFKLIEVFGSGDVRTLSGGISEALITTKFGLIVAIPSLLLHAFFARKVRGMVGQMETAAVSFVNRLSKSRHGAPAPASALVLGQEETPAALPRRPDYAKAGSPST